MDRLLGWLRMAGRLGWQMGGVAVGFVVVWTIFQRLLLLVVTVFIALLVAALLTPAARWVERLGAPRSVSAFVAIVGGTAVLLGVIALVVAQFASQMPELGEQFGEVRANVTGWLTEGPLSLTEQQIDDAIGRAVEVARARWGLIVDRAIGLLLALTALVTALVLAFFLVRDADHVTGWILNRLVSDEDRDDVAAAGRRAGQTLQGYIVATVAIGTLDAVFIGLGLLLLGVPLAVPLAVVTFLGGFFPVVGATVAGLLATLVAVATNGTVTGLTVLAIVVVVQQVDSNVLQPVIMGRAVHLHPIVVLAALTGGGILAGIVGAFMAVPTAAVLTAVGNEVRRRRGEQALLATQADGHSS